MIGIRINLRVALAAACCALTATAWTARAEQDIEQVTVATLPAANPYRLYISDVAIAHIIDGKLHIVDGEGRKYLGMVSTALAGQSTLSPDRSEIYVATTYFTRLGRGERHDQVDIYDATSLNLKAEVPIPPKHAQALNYRGTLRTSSDGRWLLVQNATPATSVSVVDLKARKFVAEIPTPGCWILLPAQSVANRFSTLCGDGTLLTVNLDGEGKPAGQKRSGKFFDPDADPLFVHAENIGDRYYFVSFKGSLYSANLGGEEAAFDKPWPLVSGADARQGWRPGGYQPLALHAETGRLFVGVHPKGKEGSHKEPAKEIWAFDLASKKRVARAAGSNAVAMTVSRGSSPRLFALDGLKGGVAIYDADAKLKLAARMEGVGETPTQIEVQ